MPMYTFKCEKCDKKLEVIQSFKDSNPVCDCTKKTVSMIRLMPMTARPKFSGSGFYETDYKEKIKKPKKASKDKKND